MTSLSRDLRVVDLHGQHGLGAPILKASREEVASLYEFEEYIALATRVEVEAALSPVLFWCRFCRAVVQPRAASLGLPFRVIADDSVPLDEARIVDSGGSVHRIVGFKNV